MPLRWEFWLLRLESRPISACFGRFGCRPIRPDMAIRPNSSQINPVRHESSRVGANPKKKKKLRRGTNAQATASDSGVAPSQPRLCFLDINTQKGSRSVLFFFFLKKKEKVQLQNQLWSKAITSFKTINIITYFENITVGLHVLYAFNTHVKFCAK